MSDRPMPVKRRLASEGRAAPSGRLWKNLAISIGVVSAFLVLGVVFQFRPDHHAELLRQEGRRAAQDGRWAEAEGALSHLSNLTPEDCLLRALAATSLNRHDVALRHLARIDPHGPFAARAALLTGRAELGRFRARPMEESLRLALRLDPTLLEARRLLVYLYGAQGRRLELVEQFSALSEQSPLTTDLVRHWCIAHLDTVNDPTEVKSDAKLRSDLEHFVQNDPEDRWSRLGLARIYRQLSLFDESKALLDPLPEADPEARACRADLAFARGDHEAVASLLAEGPQDHARLARLRGRLALIRRDGPEAVRFFRLADASEPNHWATLYGLAHALRLAGEPALAEPYARRAEAHRILRDDLTLPPRRWESRAGACCWLASDCESAGYLPEARAWYLLAISLDPLQQQAQHALFRLAPNGPRAGSGSSERVQPPQK